MNKKVYSLLCVTVACSLFFSAFAQNDSSWLDLGVLKLKRAFTQSICIKGRDLEKMPFASLSEAVNVWLYGVYSNDFSLLYVVDGNLLSDVNLYSIYDIEEIVFIQNALIQTNGAFGQSQLVLITTKKNRKAKWGINVAGQSALVRRDFNQIYPAKDLPSNSNAYHQYYLGANKNFKNMSVVVSASYLRDVLPSIKGDSVNTSIPFNLTRFRLNGFDDWKLSKKNEIYATLNYTPQKMDSAQYYNTSNTAYNGSTHQSQHVFTPFARWHSEFIPQVQNDLSITFLSSIGKMNSVLKDTNTQFSLNGESPYISSSSGTTKTKHIYIRDRLSYTVHAGAWDIEPSVSASFEHIKYSFFLGSATYFGVYNGGFLGGSSSAETSTGNGELYFLTPSLNLCFKNIFDLQGGLLDNISSSHGKKVKRGFPFLNLTLDPLRIFNEGNSAILKLFGSYAQSRPLTVNDYPLNDLSTGWFASDFMLTQFSIFGPPLQAYPAIYGTNAYLSQGFLNAHYYIWETGASLSLLNDRLQINYNFEQRRYQGEAIGYFTAYSNSYGYNYFVAFPDFISSTNFLGIVTRPINKETIQWKTSLNLTYTYTRFNPLPATYYLIQYAVGDFQNNNRPSWTGGWVNRFQFKDFSVGMDWLYHFNEVILNPIGGSSKKNSLLLENIYASYRLHSSQAKSIEIFLDSRDLFRSSKSDLMDGRRYYGIGGKMGI